MYERRAAFFMVYIHEAHPADGWQLEANISDQIIIAQPQVFAVRQALAQTCAARLALTMPEGHPHAPFFLPFFRLVDAVPAAREAHVQVEAFLCSQRVRARTEDDVTLLVGSLLRTGGHAGPISR